MFEDLKFLKTRKIAQKALGISVPSKRLLLLLNEIFGQWKPQDYREKFLRQEAGDQLVEIAALLTNDNPSAIRIFQILKNYVLALGLPKRNLESIGSEKEIRIESAPQFRAFKKAKRAVEGLVEVLHQRRDPLLPTAQMIDISNNYLWRMTTFFDEAARTQRSQRGWAQHLSKLSAEVSDEIAEMVLLGIFDDLANTDVEFRDVDTLTRKEIDRKEKAGARLSVQRKAVVHAFGRYRKEVGLPQRRRGRPKKD